MPDLSHLRADFPILHQQVGEHPLIYFDSAASSQKPRQVIDALVHYYERDNANVHRGLHELSNRSTANFEAVRTKVAGFIGASRADEIIFTRGTTEGINLVAHSWTQRFLQKDDIIIVTGMEHHSNLVPWQLAAQRCGAVLKHVPVLDDGTLDLEELERLLTNGPVKLLACVHISNSLGTVNPVRDICARARALGITTLVDGAQVVGHVPVNVQDIGSDFYVFSGHKIFGPTGIGALYGKKHLLDAMPPWQGGGHMIQDVTFEKTIYRPAPEKFEAGTPDIAGVVGLGAAIDYLFRVGIPAIAAYEHTLLEYATHALSTVPGLRPIGTAANKASVLSFIIPGLSNEAIAHHLDKQGIAVRAGHHCALPAQRHFGQDTTVRPSLAFYNTFAEVDTFVAALHTLPKR